MSNNRINQFDKADSVLEYKASNPSGQKCYTNENGDPLLKLKDTTLYIRKQMNGNQLKFIEANTIRKVGETNFDQSSFEKDRNVVIDAISLRGGLADGTTIVNDPYTSTLPPQVRNGELVMIVSGVEILRVPVMDIYIDPNAPHSNDDSFRTIGHTPFIPNEKGYQIYIELPDGTSATDLNLELAMRVNETSVN
ncbi:MAG: hypothetical protein HRT68_15780 [Flavobacteriaceae bacterium]|nr:hypothetical protein [Flavobacteriaceae bacterium]